MGVDEFLIALNLGGQKTTFRPNFRFSGTVILARDKNREGQKIEDELSLDADEGLIIKLAGDR